MANELIERRRSDLAPSGAGVMELQAHCDRLNEFEWVRASGKFYVVGKTDKGKHTVMRQGELVTKGAS